MCSFCCYARGGLFFAPLADVVLLLLMLRGRVLIPRSSRPAAQSRWAMPLDENGLSFDSWVTGLRPYLERTLQDELLSLLASMSKSELDELQSVASAGAIALQVNLIVDLVLASLLPVGAISWLYFADRVAQLPLGIIGVALGTALLPRLSAQFREDDPAAARASLAEAMCLAAFLVVPAMVALIVIAPQIIGGLFGYGAFSQAAAAASASAAVRAAHTAIAAAVTAT